MNYIGSKLKLSEFIKDTILTVTGKNIKDKIFCDLFAGTGIIGRVFKKEVKQIISNDIEYYSYVLNRNYIGNHKPIVYKKYIEELNSLKGKKGFIYKNYCLGGGSGRMFFSDLNGQKIDIARNKIEEWKQNKEISENQYYFLLASLLESADKVANTACVYGAFLKKFKKSALNILDIQPALYEINSNEHLVYNEDANNLIKHISGDILYLDPPYNSRQYGANYHLLNTIARYDNFIPKGKTGLRQYFKSDFCVSSKVGVSFEHLIKEAKFKYIFISYNNDGLMPFEDIKCIMKKYGRYDVLKHKYIRFKSDTDSKKVYKTEPLYEYLHVLEKF